MGKFVKNCQNQLGTTFFRQKRRNLVLNNTTFDNLFCFVFQARYRQYFEEDLADPNNDAEAMIPMETQVLMQEVLTDGMAFCSLM